MSAERVYTTLMSAERSKLRDLQIMVAMNPYQQVPKIYEEDNIIRCVSQSYVWIDLKLYMLWP